MIVLIYCFLFTITTVYTTTEGNEHYQEIQQVKSSLRGYPSSEMIFESNEAVNGHLDVIYDEDALSVENKLSDFFRSHIKRASKTLNPKKKATKLNRLPIIRMG